MSASMPCQKCNLAALERAQNVGIGGISERSRCFTSRTSLRPGME